jgi:hypothetical protein
MIRRRPIGCGIPTVSLALISDHEVRRVIELITRSPILDRVAEWKELDRRGPGGRPANISEQALLVGMTLAALDGSTSLRHVQRILFDRISRDMRQELGLEDWRLREWPKVYDQLWVDSSYRNVVDALARLVALMDPSQLPKNHVIDGHDYERFALLWTPRCRVEPPVAKERLHWFANQMLEISISALPREVRRSWKGSVAIDGTPIKAFARPDRRLSGSKSRLERRLLRSSADPDAGFYVRTGDHSGDRSGESISKMQWAYESTIAVMVHDEPASAAPFPHLIVGASVLDRPGTEPGLQAVSVLSSIVERGHPSQWVVVDNLFPNQKPEKFQLPSRELGYQPVFEYTAGQQGKTDEYHGAIQVEGRWCCPQMPQPLISASIDRAAGMISEELYRERVNARIAYEFRANGKPQSDGSQRFLCPAAGTSPTVKCDRKPASLKSPRPVPVVITTKSQKKLVPKACRQVTIKMPVGVGAKFGQELRFGSERWSKLYRTSRSTNEGTNGIAKRAHPIDISNPNIRRVRGVAAQTILHSIQLMAINLDRIRAFLTAKVHDPDWSAKNQRRQKRAANSNPFSPRGTTSNRATGPPALV